jgi:hypothetical protein
VAVSGRVADRNLVPRGRIWHYGPSAGDYSDRTLAQPRVNFVVQTFRISVMCGLGPGRLKFAIAVPLRTHAKIAKNRQSSSYKLVRFRVKKRRWLGARRK